MGRELGTSGFAGAYIVYSTTALDPRLVVDTYAELFDSKTWPQQGGVTFVYNGMQVAVLETQDTYMLVDSSKYDKAEGWRKQNTGNSLLCTSLTVNGKLTVTSDTAALFNAPVTFNQLTTHNGGIKSKSILPLSGSFDLGSSSARWNKLWASTANFNSKISIDTGIITDGSDNEIIAANSSRFELGKGHMGKTLWLWARDYKFNVSSSITTNQDGTTSSKPAVIIAPNGRVGIGDVGGAPAAALHVANGYVIANGYKLWTPGVPTMEQGGYAVMTNGTYMKISSISSSFDGEQGTVAETPVASRINVASTSHTHSGSTNSLSGEAEVAAKEHSHELSASGSVTPTFKGSAVTSGKTSSNISVVGSAHTHAGTTNGPGTAAVHSTTVAAKDHTHTIDIPTGISSEFTGTENQSTEGTTLSVVYTASSLDLKITTSHQHYYTAEGSVDSSISTSATKTTSKESNTSSVASTSHTHGFTAPASESTQYSVSTSEHQHSVTAAGTIDTFTVSVTGSTSGTSGSTKVASNSHSHNVAVTAPADNTTNKTLVPKPDHKHTFTPEGSITSEFDK